MKKKNIKKVEKMNFDLVMLKHWKGVSTKSKLDWLASALRFGRFRKF